MSSSLVRMRVEVGGWLAFGRVPSCRLGGRKFLFDELVEYARKGVNEFGENVWNVDGQVGHRSFIRLASHLLLSDHNHAHTRWCIAELYRESIVHCRTVQRNYCDLQNCTENLLCIADLCRE